MSRITAHQLSGLATAGVLSTYAAKALSDFERDLLGEVCARLITRGPETTITEAEWTACHAAIQGMLNYSAALHEVRYPGVDGVLPPGLVRRGGRC